MHDSAAAIGQKVERESGGFNGFFCINIQTLGQAVLKLSEILSEASICESKPMYVCARNTRERESVWKWCVQRMEWGGCQSGRFRPRGVGGINGGEVHEEVG